MTKQKITHEDVGDLSSVLERVNVHAVDAAGNYLGVIDQEDVASNDQVVPHAPPDRRQKWDGQTWLDLPTVHVVNQDGDYIGEHAGDLPDGAIVVSHAPADDRQKWDGKQWLDLEDHFYNADMTGKRRLAYIAESDHLGMQVLRGEYPLADYIDKVAEIKNRYPKKGIQNDQAA